MDMTVNSALAGAHAGAGAERAFLEQLFRTAIAAAQPVHCMTPHLEQCLPRQGTSAAAGRLIVIGAGKASAEMARVVEDYWGDGIEGLVVARYGHGAPCAQVEVVEAAHPVPDGAGRDAAARMLALVSQLDAADTVLCLVSGGGSALLPLPLSGITLEDKQSLSRALLASGASIGEMNCVRRHLSAIKGGRLAAACHPARVITLLISDVPGDDPCDIASGPTVADASTCHDALAIIDRYGIALAPHVREILASGAGESVKPGDPRLAGNEVRLVATPQMALAAAAAAAHRAGIDAYILGDGIEGEARDVGKTLAAIALQAARRGQPFRAPCVLLSGGETTVTLRGDGSGGRNVEFLLAAALALRGAAGVHGLAGDTDGVDGREEIAGAYIAPDTLARAFAQGIRPLESLDRNDGHGFFQALGDAVITGPTLTNVNDFRAFLILDPAMETLR